LFNISNTNVPFKRELLLGVINSKIFSYFKRNPKICRKVSTMAFKCYHQYVCECFLSVAAKWHYIPYHECVPIVWQWLLYHSAIWW